MEAKTGAMPVYPGGCPFFCFNPNIPEANRGLIALNGDLNPFGLLARGRNREHVNRFGHATRQVFKFEELIRHDYVTTRGQTPNFGFKWLNPSNSDTPPRTKSSSTPGPSF